MTFRGGSRLGQIKMEQFLFYRDNSSSKIADLEELLIFIHDQNENRFYEMDKIKWHGKYQNSYDSCQLLTFLFNLKVRIHPQITL